MVISGAGLYLVPRRTQEIVTIFFFATHETEESLTRSLFPVSPPPSRLKLERKQGIPEGVAV